MIGLCWQNEPILVKLTWFQLGIQPGYLRLMPGTEVAQEGQMGAQTSLFVRGGGSDDSKILLDGVDAGDLGVEYSRRYRNVLSGASPPDSAARVVKRELHRPRPAVRLAVRS